MALRPIPPLPKLPARRPTPSNSNNTAPPTQADNGSAVSAGTGKQVNQTFSIAMMASPVNPLPFMLPIPVGIAMLLGPSGSRKT
ncbi:hypothetical protein GE09DRAFT_1105983 [Coniochaeta sp. 2T2.1]|nr:hypothetical protein GE09DRAFT_1105983 [Coniochaeta sp. 2T2.1]